MAVVENIHGHEVLKLIASFRKPLSKRELFDEVARRYGPEAHFCTCSASGMTIEELYGFLAERGKLVERDETVSADIGKMCSGDSNDHNH